MKSVSVRGHPLLLNKYTQAAHNSPSVGLLQYKRAGISSKSSPAWRVSLCVRSLHEWLINNACVCYCTLLSLGRYLYLLSPHASPRYLFWSSRRSAACTGGIGPKLIFEYRSAIGHKINRSGRLIEGTVIREINQVTRFAEGKEEVFKDRHSNCLVS